jgi:hypothetical protein
MAPSAASGGSVHLVTGCSVCISAQAQCFGCERAYARSHPHIASERLNEKAISHARSLSTNKTNDASPKCMTVRLFVAMLLGADLPYDPLLPELALLVGDHDAIVS